MFAEKTIDTEESKERRTKLGPRSREYATPLSPPIKLPFSEQSALEL